jgi:hypothetical protein
MAGGELVMVGAALLFMRDIVSGPMALDFLRGLGAGAVTIALMRLLPPLSPIAGIPLCVVMFGAVAAAVGLVRRSDLELLVPAFRRPGSVAGPGDRPQ